MFLFYSVIALSDMLFLKENYVEGSDRRLPYVGPALQFPHLA